MNTLPFDILSSIFDLLVEPKALYASSLVSSTFCEASLPSLYRAVDLRPLYSDEPPKFVRYRALETIEKHPYLKSYVREINQWGVISDGLHDISDPNISSLSTFTNLVSYTLHSSVDGLPFIPPKSFLEIVKALTELPLGRLRELHLDFNVYSYHFRNLIQLRNLRRITLGRPSRFVLENIPEWMDGMKDTLEAFQVLDGSKIDAMLIANIQPRLCNIRALSLGHSLTLSAMDLLNVLRDTPQIEYLSLFYNNWANPQQEQPVTPPNSTGSSKASEFPGLIHLLDLQITYQGVGNKSQYNAMLWWILQLTPLGSPSSTLQRLTIISDDHKEVRFASSGYLSVFLKRCLPPARTRVGKEQNTTTGLKVLNIPFVRFTSKELCDAVLKCGELHEVEVGVVSKEEGYSLIVSLLPR